MGDNMKKELCIHAFESACESRAAHGMILHSDRGSQFTSAAFRKTLAKLRSCPKHEQYGTLL
jgi:transposase InsO family protein